jgi:hypothetical protein
VLQTAIGETTEVHSDFTIQAMSTETQSAFGFHERKTLRSCTCVIDSTTPPERSTKCSFEKCIVLSELTIMSKE